MAQHRIGGGGNDLAGHGYFEPGAWVRVSVTWDGHERRVYVNGELGTRDVPGVMAC